jgi:hypothetical protein
MEELQKDYDQYKQSTTLHINKLTNELKELQAHPVEPILEVIKDV